MAANRTQILRIDCRGCRGNGYVVRAGEETQCGQCGGSGCEEKQVPFKFETNGNFTKEEIADAFGISPLEVRDSGHSTGEGE